MMQGTSIMHGATSRVRAVAAKYLAFEDGYE